MLNSTLSFNQPSGRPTRILSNQNKTTFYFLQMQSTLCQLPSRLLIFALFTILITGFLDSSAFTAKAHPAPLASAYNRPSLRQENLCSNPPLNSCNFYAECLETKYHCGPDGYPIGFGQKFCQKFDASRSKLSADGQNWISSTMHCLQKELVPEATSTAGVTCDSIEKKAFASHGKCYVDNGLCTLPPSDWVQIIGIVEFKNLFNSKEAFLATLDAGKGCLKAYLFFLKELVF